MNRDLLTERESLNEPPYIDYDAIEAEIASWKDIENDQIKIDESEND